MKKITAFFMALFPFLVIGILFATGLIAKDFTDKTVQRLEMKSDTIKVRKEGNDKLEYSVADNVRVLPDIVRDPTVYWTTDDATLASVEKETGKVTVNEFGYGDIKLHAVAKTNAAAKADCTLKVWDNKIHKIEVTNKEQAEFITPGSSMQLQVKTIPSELIDDPKLEFSIKEGTGYNGFSITPNGIVIASAAANGKATAVVNNPATGIKTEIELNAGRTVSAIGFANDGDVLTQNGTYNLLNGDDKVITAPFNVAELETVSKYISFESSDPTNAPIDEKTGVITFNSGYIPGTFVDYTVRFANLDSISATKRVASSLNYYSKVTFDDYQKTLQLDLTQPVCIKDDVKYRTYPAKGDPNRLTLISNNPDVIEIKDGLPYAKAEGKATLTIKAQVTAASVISDTVDVTIINKNTPRILNEESLIIDSSRNYPLRKSLLPAYANKKIEWSMPAEATGTAILDKTNETINFLKLNTPVKVTATYTFGTTKVSDIITLTCTCSKVTTLNVEDGSGSITAGDQVQFKKSGNVVLLKTKPDQLTLNDTNAYVATCGSLKTLNVEVDDSTTFKLTIYEPVIDFKAKNDLDFSHYSTNAKVIDVGSTFTPYPATATVTETYWGREVIGSPTITYTYKSDDDSAVDIKNNVLTYSKATTTYITATSHDKTKQYVVSSYCGGNGKFSLVKENGDAIENGSTLTAIAPNDTFNCYISNFGLADIEVTSEELEAFKIKALSGDKIVKVDTPLITQDKKMWFSFSGVSAGKDVVEISNGSFTFYMNVEVSSKVTNVDLYCLGNKLTKNTNDNILVYTTNDLIINMDFAPVVAYSDTLDITFNEAEWTSKPGVSLNLSQGAQVGSTTINWKTGPSDVNTLTISFDNEVLASYNFVCSSVTPDFEIVDSYKVDTNKYNMYLNTTTDHDYTVMEINIDNAVYSQDYFKDKFHIDSSWQQAQIYGKYIVGPSPAVGESMTVTIDDDSSNVSKQYTVKRDLISKITLPKHDNLDESDAKGLQRVHVYGTQTQYANETKSDIYRLPISIFDAKGNEITGEAKTKAMATLKQPSDLGVADAKYNATTGYMDIKFKQDAANIYTAEEIFNNAFASLETNKNQLFEIYTEYGQHHLTEPCHAFYSFVVVNGVNVYDQKGITDTLALPDKNLRNIVLQINFGIQGETETTPFTLTSDFAVNDLYGNGYGINFDAFTKAHMDPPTTGTISAHHAFNAQLIGCNPETFGNLKDRSCTWGEGGTNTEETQDLFAYCYFTRYFQTFTIWSSEQEEQYYYIHLKNCCFFNEAERCRVTLSISNPRCVATVENCAFFNSSKVVMLVNKQATIRFKGDCDVYNFHASDMFDALGWEHSMSELAWEAVVDTLDKANLIQSTEYGATGQHVNAYLITALVGYVQFYDHTDESGKDVYVDAQHGSEKAANYLRYGTGVRLLGVDLADIWTTSKPPLPLQLGHSPAYSDEFYLKGETPHLNTDTWNLLLVKLSRW